MTTIEIPEGDVLSGQDPHFPHARFPNALTLDPGITRRALSADAKILWAVIDTFVRKKESGWPGQARLAEEMDASERSVRRWIAELRDHGWLKIRPRLVHGRKVGNRYFLIVINRAAEERIQAWREARKSADRTELAGSSERPNEAGCGPDRTGLSADRTELAGSNGKHSTSVKHSTENHTPPTPLAEGGVEPGADEVQVIDAGAGEVVDGAEPVLTVKRGARIDLAPDGFPLARELRALWAEAVEAAGLTVPAGPDTGDKRARGELARRLAEDGYTPEQLRTAVAHWRGSLYLAGLHDGQIRGLDFGLVLSNRSIAEGLAAAANGGPDPSRAARYRQATRNPMLAAAATAAPEGMGRDPRRDRDVIDALDDALRILREEAVRAGKDAPLRLTPEQEEEVIREALAARAVPC